MFERDDLMRARNRRAFNASQEEARRLASTGERCPDCGEVDAIEDNGGKGGERAWRCQTCNCQWDAAVGADG